MSLPWFAFNIKDFIANTKRLNAEAKGAYLLLMLDYYEQEQGPPDDDDVLATICELSPEAWAKHRKVLAPLFHIEGGVWRHARIEKEILEAGLKLASSHARAVKGGEAYARKMGSRPAPSQPQATERRPDTVEQASSQASSRPEATPEAGLERAHLHLHLKKDSLSTDRDAIGGKKLIDAPEVLQYPGDRVQDGVGTHVDPLFSLGPNQVAVCKFDGATIEIIEAQRAGFIAYHQERGNLSNDWDASWKRWWQRWKEHRDKEAAKRPAKSAPRIEVNNTAIDYEAHVSFFKQIGTWPKGIGPDPDSPACRASREILIKHGYAKEPAT